MCQPKQHLPTGKVFNALRIEKMYTSATGAVRSFNLEIQERDLEDFVDALGAILRGFPTPIPVASVIASFSEERRGESLPDSHRQFPAPSTQRQPMQEPVASTSGSVANVISIPATAARSVNSSNDSLLQDILDMSD